IRPGDRLLTAVPGLVVSFTEALSTTGPGSATDPANWRLTRNGYDISARITGITFGLNAATNRYEAALSLSAPLGDGDYALAARHTLTDLAGNHLDGRSDASGSDFTSDFTRSFTVAGVRVAGAETRANTYT